MFIAFYLFIAGILWPPRRGVQEGQYVGVSGFQGPLENWKRIYCSTCPNSLTVEEFQPHHFPLCFTMYISGSASDQLNTNNTLGHVTTKWQQDMHEVCTIWPQGENVFLHLVSTELALLMPALYERSKYFLILAQYFDKKVLFLSTIHVHIMYSKFFNRLMQQKMEMFTSWIVFFLKRCSICSNRYIKHIIFIIALLFSGSYFNSKKGVKKDTESIVLWSKLYSIIFTAQREWY